MKNNKSVKVKVLTINCGSSSIKYKLYSFPKGNLLYKGMIERIGEKKSSVKNHSQGMSLVFSQLISDKAINSLDEIKTIGHRVVHGADVFCQPHIVDNKVIKKIKECVELAPLHNPANLDGIEATKKLLPKVTQVAVFDTAFHQTIPTHAHLYALPMKYYKKHKIRRYGFHGSSHQYVMGQAAKILKRPANKLKIITCHLGNGCSIAAIDKGKSVDTSMGFTPLEGLVMGSRCGDIDPAIVFYLMHKEKLSYHQVDNILNRESGLLGLSGISNDVRVLTKAAKKGNKRARIALTIFLYRIKKYIGAYHLVLGGADAVVFTAGVGENNPQLIKSLAKDIQKIAPKTKVLVVPTNEELMIASLTFDLIKNKI